jgi:acetyl-CoA/propionyl-CoA carboxylase biotin carboxyl carrier protein
MQATVVKVLVEPGSAVVAGDLICVLEAMKMEQPIMAPNDGTVESVGVSPGDSVSGGHVLVVIS